ncbi:uncharacterized protein LOC143220304 [Lasioglossum baleicum]|uniref:uncharacterized protein LOC143220304 n=1 Tax=Lasioglossum baleicum TaxID=434251 RepID=UPI003FCCE0C8
MRSGSRRTFRLTRVLSGLGCIWEDLHKIGEEVPPGCWHCEEEVHSAQHTLEERSAWAPERRELQLLVGWDLSLYPAWLRAVEFGERWPPSASRSCSGKRRRSEVANRGPRSAAVSEEDRDCGEPRRRLAASQAGVNPTQEGNPG